MGEAALEAEVVKHKIHTAPATRRTFTSPWIELDYLCKKLHYWLYKQNKKKNAERYIDRLERVLKALPPDELAILRHEGLALLYELRGRADKAIEHRMNEIDLMERLHSEAGSPRYAASTRAYMLRDRELSALEERRAILKALQDGSFSRTGAAIRRPVRWDRYGF
jgi:hypothetical protein